MNSGLESLTHHCFLPCSDLAVMAEELASISHVHPCAFVHPGSIENPHGDRGPGRCSWRTVISTDRCVLGFWRLTGNAKCLLPSECDTPWSVVRPWTPRRHRSRLGLTQLRMFLYVAYGCVHGLYNVSLALCYCQLSLVFNNF